MIRPARAPSRTFATWMRSAAVWLVAAFAASCGGPDPGEALVDAIPRRDLNSAGETADASAGRAATDAPVSLVTSVLDPRVEPLLQAARRWRSARGPDRAVIDQVHLVPDLPAFLEAIAAWDARSYYPILIDDPAWTLPFLRAFGPARVVRVAPRLREPNEAPPQPRDASALWQAAERAVARAWVRETPGQTDLPHAATVPAQLGTTPPGLVFSNPESPMLAGAVALAAGRFQPLLRLDPLPAPASPGVSSDASPPLPKYAEFHDVLTLSQARGLARVIERRATATVGAVDSLGDGCDFLTLALDWPYRYRNDAEGGVIRGDQALDDLLGRILETEEGTLETSRRRWAFTGRLLGDPAASVYRAMCALFLAPAPSLLWDTYSGTGVWAAYQMDQTAKVLTPLSQRTAPPLLRAGATADLAAWHQVMDPAHGFGWIMLNSSGGPRQWSIRGGNGLPADIPRGRPVAVSMIHSFSASDPLDASTIAGRWLENGAFVYLGAMNEPYLHAFRLPLLVAGLAAAEVPLAAALRQGEDEPFGRPWRLVYLGDPLFHFPSAKAAARGNRVPPEMWRAGASEAPPAAAETITAESRWEPPSGDDASRLRACLNAAIAAACSPDPSGSDKGGTASRSPAPSAAWQDTLARIDRGKLPAHLREVLDEAMIDALLQRPDIPRLYDWLRGLPPDECAPRVRSALETIAMSRLQALVRESSTEKVLDLWEQMMQWSWPTGSPFPGQLTDRLAAWIDRDSSHRLAPYLERLDRLSTARAPASSSSPVDAVLRTERLRLRMERPTPSPTP